jgi:hypothetical protein
VSAACQWREMIRKEREGVVDPEDGEDAGEAMVEEDVGVAGRGEFSCCDGGDDDAADDEEDIHADIAVAEEAKVLGGEVSLFDSVQVGEDDEEGRDSATDLDADDSVGLWFRNLLQELVPVALLYQRERDGTDRLAVGGGWIEGWSCEDAVNLQQSAGDGVAKGWLEIPELEAAVGHRGAYFRH